VSQQTRLSAASLDPSLDPSGDPQPNGGSGGSPAPTTGFFRVFHIPDFLINFTNHTFSDLWFIPIDYAAPDADVNYVEDTTVLIGGQPTDEARFMSYPIGGVNYWGVGINFARFPNGTNTIQLVTTVRQSDQLNDQTPYMVFSNAPAAINIQNLISYTNWSDLIINGSYTFNLQCVPNVDWEIDIYDWNGNFVNYQTGHSSDGNISWAWNLIDYWGNSHGNFDSDPAFFPYITITGNLPSLAQNGGAQPNAGSSSSSTWADPFGHQYPSIGGWLFAYMDRFYLDGTPNDFANSCMHGGLNSMTGGPAQWGEPSAQYPLSYGYPPYHSQSDRDSSWTNFATYLYFSGTRNLYYFGHGNPNSIGGDWTTTDAYGNKTGAAFPPGSKAELTGEYIRKNITSNRKWGPRRYRFVFLDCCSGAAPNGNLPWAFDIPSQSEPLSYYHTYANKSQARPSAFVAWDTYIGGPGWGSVSDWWNCRADWMALWSGVFQEHLDDAIYDANTISGWIPPSTYYGHIKIWGYSVMMFDDYNYGGDWVF
jgi:hypothetical protein